MQSTEVENLMQHAVQGVRLMLYRDLSFHVFARDLSFVFGCEFVLQNISAQVHALQVFTVLLNRAVQTIPAHDV